MANASTTKMIDDISHEMKTQLSTIIMALKNVEFLLSDLNIGQNIADEIETISRTASHTANSMKESIDTLIALHGLFTPRTIILNELMDLFADRIQTTNSSLRVVREYGNAELEIFTDYRALNLAFHNLFAGLAGYLAHGGDIVISINPADDAQRQNYIKITIVAQPPSGAMVKSKEKYEQPILLSTELLRLLKARILKNGIVNGTYEYSMLLTRP